MRTGQSAQMRFASREDPPFSGKKISGSNSRQRARSCHGTKWCTVPSPNYILVILDQNGRKKQVRTETTPRESLLQHHLEESLQAIAPSARVRRRKSFSKGALPIR